MGDHVAMPGPSEMSLPAWVDEIDFDPTVMAPAMGTRRLADRDWLVPASADEGDLLALRRSLVAERRAEVVEVDDVPEPVAVEIATRVCGAVPPGDDHPLVRAAVAVVEDLCVLRRESAGWTLVGGVLCFPSSWRLSEKVGRPLLDVHEPVPGYEPVLHDRVESLLDRLADRVVWRRNWFLHAHDAWFQPERHDLDDVVTPDRLDDDLWLRSERQTLSGIAGSSDGADWALFTIRVQHVPLGPVLHARGGELGRFLAGTDARRWRRHGLGVGQADVLAARLGVSIVA